MEDLTKFLFKGNIDRAVDFIEKNLGKYGKDFKNYYDMFYQMQKIFRPEEYPDRPGIIHSSLVIVLKKAYKNRDFEKINKIKEFIEVLKDFSGEGHDISG